MQMHSVGNLGVCIFKEAERTMNDVRGYFTSSWTAAASLSCEYINSVLSSTGTKQQREVSRMEHSPPISHTCSK